MAEGAPALCPRDKLQHVPPAATLSRLCFCHFRSVQQTPGRRAGENRGPGGHGARSPPEHREVGEEPGGPSDKSLAGGERSSCCWRRAGVSCRGSVGAGGRLSQIKGCLKGTKAAPRS